MDYVFIIHFYKYRKDDAVYTKAYDSLLKQFARIGIRRDESQTFREYALHVDTLYNSADMQQLTFSYENAIYQKDKPQQNGKIRTLMGSAYEKAASPPKSNDFHSAI